MSDGLSVAGSIASCIAIPISIYAIYIANKIARQQDGVVTDLQRIVRTVDEHILGSLSSIAEVTKAIEVLLEEADKEGAATSVHASLYWTWLGADLNYPSIAIKGIEQHHSKIHGLLFNRLSKRLPTELVVYEPDDGEDKLRRFLSAALKYNQVNTVVPGISGGTKDVGEDDVDGLLKRYRNALNHLEKSSKTVPEFSLKAGTEIASVMIARSGVKPVAIICLLETSALEQMAGTGGFLTSRSEMVKMVIDQIHAAAQRCPDLE